MKLVPIVSVTALLVASTWTFLSLQKNDKPAEEGGPPLSEIFPPPSNPESVKAECTFSSEKSESTAISEPAEKAPKTNEALSPKEAIMLRFEEKEKPEKSEMTDEEKVLIKHIAERLKLNDPTAKAELFEFLDNDASPPLYFIAGNFLAEEGDFKEATDFYVTGLESDKYMTERTRLRMTRNAGIMMVKSAPMKGLPTILSKRCFSALNPMAPHSGS